MFDHLGVDIRVHMDRFIGKQVAIRLYYNDAQTIVSDHWGLLTRINRVAGTSETNAWFLYVLEDNKTPIEMIMLTEEMTGTIRILS